MSGKEKYTHTVTLKHPIEWGSETITQLRFMSPKGKHFKKMPMEPKNFGDIFPFVAATCDQPAAVLDELEAEDIMQVMDLIGGFIPGGPETGAKYGRS